MGMLDQKTAIVTGGARGIGLAIAKRFIAEGARVVIADMDEATGKAAAASLGSAARFVRTDVGAAGDARNVVAEACGVSGDLDILVNNAGIIRRADILEHAEADWDAVTAVDLDAAFFVSQGVAAQMRDAGLAGRIINVASLLSFQGGIRVAAYTAAKHGLAGLTKAMANELAPFGITVNAIAPGYMATDNTEALRADSDRAAQILARIPTGRWGEPADLGAAAVFLASPAAGYVTGTILPVDGGWLAR
jgi:2-dehydro-3-deoxy-D-gluconate 5-dehydrogenase